MNREAARKILVCDDDGPFRRRLARSLRDRDLAVFEAEDARTALEVLSSYEVDSAVVDLRMPHENGLWLVQQIKRKYPLVRVVVLTGFGSISTAIQAVKLGAVNYLTKPVSTEQLLAAFTAEPAPVNTDDVELPSLAEMEAEYVNRVLDEFDGNVSRSAKVLGLHRRSLQRKLVRR